MARVFNWDLSKVISLVRQEAEAEYIMEETGIKRHPLQSIVSMLGSRDRKFYYIRGLFK